MKRFDEWNNLKKSLHGYTPSPEEEIFIKPREIWITYWGVNLGFETDGGIENFTRPALVLKKI